MKFSESSIRRAVHFDTSLWPVNRLPRNVVYNTCGVGWSPHEYFEDVWPDIERLIGSIIFGCTDDKNVNLHFEELHGEMMQKLTQLLNRRDVLFEDREGFFGMLKVSLTRHMSSIIQKYVFTFKRTGVKPPKKGEKPTEQAESVKIPEHRVNLELDDDEHGTVNYVGQEDGGFKDREIRDALQFFIKEHLTPAEAKVLRQEMEPNDRAMELAFMSNRIGRRSRTFKVQDRHKAEGIDMQVYVYKRTLGRVRAKMLKYWEK